MIYTELSFSSHFSQTDTDDNFVEEAFPAILAYNLIFLEKNQIL